MGNLGSMETIFLQFEGVWLLRQAPLPPPGRRETTKTKGPMEMDLDFNVPQHLYAWATGRVSQLSVIR